MTVYFARNASDKLIKIGFSQNVRQRLGGLQNGTGGAVSMIWTTSGNRAEERAFHIRFKDCHERGEWFREEGKLLKFLQEKKVDYERTRTAAEEDFKNELVRGFCKNPVELKMLYALGIPDNNIYMRGRGAETLDACLATFRDRPGRLILACDLRIFGEKRHEIVSVMDRLETMNIRVTDITHPDNNTHTKLLEQGTRAASKVRFLRNRRAARRVGAAGGNAKGAAAAARRNARVADDIVDRLVSDEAGLSWKMCAWILGEGFTAPSLFRHYGKA